MADGSGGDPQRRLSNATMGNLQAIESMQKATLTDYKKTIKKKKEKGGPHMPKTEVERRHKIILFGRLYKGLDEEEERLYQFIHQRADGLVRRTSLSLKLYLTVTVTSIFHAHAPIH